MGFKDIRAFNQALLAKQGWRVLTNESSLLHQIYKAKYFSHTTFMESKLRHAPSYTWRGIWETKSLLKKGFRW